MSEMNRWRKNIVLCLLVVFLGYGCATSGASYQRSNLTFGMIKKNLVKGQTDQAEVLSLFGAPNIMTRNKSGEEVWTYDKIAVSTSDVAGALGGVGVFPNAAGAGGVAGSHSTTNSRSMTLAITFFSDKDIVKDYAMMAQEF